MKRLHIKASDFDDSGAGDSDVQVCVPVVVVEKPLRELWSFPSRDDLHSICEERCIVSETAGTFMVYLEGSERMLWATSPPNLNVTHVE